MSDNVGLSTPRGSGTSGYVQRNLAHPHHHQSSRLNPYSRPPPPLPPPTPSANPTRGSWTTTARGKSKSRCLRCATSWRKRES
ncbi:hypothetical protein B0T21DRAFT_444192 [Apiosordaria backusii]|uniref:Uncharacterized protein n=1 Tax=Apiosordaria backusii TaxID=314023 RepID=A0AA40E909_9PEZI|nr:hypothetical protein B0T21DRAFT_444192 [Apiosordaria backusii]